MKSALVISGMFVASLATAPGAHAEGRSGSRAAAPAQPRAVAVQRSEPRAMPSLAFRRCGSRRSEVRCGRGTRAGAEHAA